MTYPELDLIILKTLISNKKNALSFANAQDSKLFSPELWNASNVIVNYIKTYKELPTLKVITEKLAKNDKLVEHVKSVWEQIEKQPYDDKEFIHNLDKLKRRFAEKQIVDIKEKLSKSESIDISKTIGDMQKTIQNIKNLNQTQSFSSKTIKEAIPDFKEEYNARVNDPEFDCGIKTGYSYLDAVTDGLRGGEFLLIGGESSSGKSMLLMNMAIQMWMQNNTVDMDNFTPGQHILYFSLEMPFKPCLNRVLARLSGCPSKLIRNAKLDAEELKRLKKALKFIHKYPYEFKIIDIPRGATIQNIESIYEDCKSLFDPKIVVIDYLGLMEGDSSTNGMDDWLKLGYISAACHEFGRVHDCIVLSAVQLNRVKPSKDTEEKIGMHRVGRSAMIMQNANIAIQIETRIGEINYNDLSYVVIKNRDGELGKGRIIKNFKCGTLVDDKQDENATEFSDYNSDDVSSKADLLTI